MSHLGKTLAVGSDFKSKLWPLHIENATILIINEMPVSEHDTKPDF